MSKRKLLLNSLSGTILYSTNIIVAFIMSPILVRALGNADFGVWEMVMAVVGYMGILDLGVGGALLRQVALAKGKEDQQDLQETISTAMVFFLVIGLLVLLSFLVLSKNPQLLVGAEHSSSDRLGIVFLYFAANSAVLFPLKVFTGVLLGLQQHHIVNVTRFLLIIVRSIVAYYFLTNFPEKGLLVLVILELISNFLQFIVYTVTLWLGKILSHCSLIKYNTIKMREMFGYGGKSALLLIASRIQFASMPFIIAKSLGVDMIVYYALPSRLVDYAKGFALTIGFPLTPFFTDLLGKNNLSALKVGWLTTAFVLQGFTLAMPFFLFFCGKNFLQLWIGSDYGVIGQYVLYALVVGLMAEACSPNARQVLLAANHHGRMAVFALAMAVCSIPLALIGAKFFGISGAAFGCSMATVLVSFFTLHATCRVMETTLLEYAQKTIFPFVIPLVMLGGGLWTGGVLLLPSNNYRDLVIQVAFGAAVYLVGVWTFSLPAAIRHEISVWGKCKMEHAKQLAVGWKIK